MPVGTSIFSPGLFEIKMSLCTWDGSVRRWDGIYLASSIAQGGDFVLGIWSYTSTAANTLLCRVHS